MSDPGRELRAAIFADPGNDAPRAVYADYLLERGNLLGRFIAAQLRHDHRAAAVDLAVAIQSSLLPVERNAGDLPRLPGEPPGLDPRLRCFTRGFARAVSISGAPLVFLGDDSWPVVERLRLASGEEEGQLLAELAPRLVSLTHFHCGTARGLQAMAHFRPRHLASLGVDAFDEWVPLERLIGPHTLLDLRSQDFGVQRQDSVVRLSVGARATVPVERVLRAVVRPNDAIVIERYEEDDAALDLVRAALERVPHGAVSEYPMYPVG